MYSIHAGSFLIWIVLVLAHVIGHARDLRRLAAKDWLRRSRAAVPGALVRQLAVLASLAAGLALALSLVGHAGTFQNTATHPHGAPHRAGAAVLVLVPGER
jgi:hypothetical protein